MKKTIFVLVGFMALASLGQATPVLAPIPGIVSTGAGLAEGDTDVNFLLISAPAGIPINISPKVVKSTVDFGNGPQPAFPLWPGAWVPNDANSQWLALHESYADPGPKGYGPSDAAGWYTYLLTFQLPSDYAAQHASITGSWAADNRGELYLNGIHQSELYTPPLSGGPWGSNTHTCDATDNLCFMAMHAFEITGGFVSGVNQLEFRVWNEPQEIGNPAGFRTTISSAAYAVPEPSAVALWLGGLGALALLRRRKAA